MVDKIRFSLNSYQALIAQDDAFDNINHCAQSNAGYSETIAGIK